MASRTARGRVPPLADEFSSLAEEVARDSLRAARLGWRIANRVGRRGLEWVERATDQALKDLK